MTEIFTAETTWKRRGKPAVLRVSKYGHIRFSVSTVRALGLGKGDKISFMIDYRDKGVVYFFKDEKGMALRFCTRGKERIDGLQVCCRPMAFKIMEHFGFTDNKTFDITNEKVNTEDGEMWMILKSKIHKPIKWKRKESNIL